MLSICLDQRGSEFAVYRFSRRSHNWTDVCSLDSQFVGHSRREDQPAHPGLDQEIEITIASLRTFTSVHSDDKASHLQQHQVVTVHDLAAVVVAEGLFDAV